MRVRGLGRRWFARVSVAILVAGFGVVPSPVSAGTGGATVDAIGDVVNPKGDVTMLSLVYGESGGSLRLSVRLAQVVGEADPGWSSTSTTLLWLLDVNQDGKFDYDATFNKVSSSGVRRPVMRGHGSDAALCEGTYVVQHAQASSTYTVSFPYSCIGTPNAVSVAATLQWDGDPNADGPVTRDLVARTPTAGFGGSPGPVGGYWLLGGDGGVFSFGNATFHGSTGNLRLNKPVVGMAPTPHRDGYWFVASDGGVFSFGSAVFRGSTGNITLNQPVVGMAATPTGDGYWLVASDGGIFAFGDARFFGSTGNIRLNRPIVGMASTPSGNGYWLVASDGGIFAFGDAQFLGSTGGRSLPHPIVGIGTQVVAQGYWLLAADGVTYTFGPGAVGRQSGTSDRHVAIMGDPSGQGFYLVTAAGRVRPNAGAGDLAGVNLAAPIVGAALV